MKLNSIILETINDQIDAIIARYKKGEGYYVINNPPDSIENFLLKACKAVSPKYWKWVLKQIYKGHVILYYDTAFNPDNLVQWVCLETPLPADIPLHMHTARYAYILSQYEKISASLQGKERDINHFDSLSDLYLTIQSFEKQQASAAMEGLEVVASDGMYKVVRINTPWDLEKVGHGTGWCTRGDAPSCRSEHYIQDFGHIYVLFKGNDPYIQFTPDLSEAQYPSRIYATNELVSILLSMDIKDDELVIDLMGSDLFWSALKASSSPNKNEILMKYETAMAQNLKDSRDDHYLGLIAQAHRYFGLNSEEDKRRLRQYQGLTLHDNDADIDDPPF